MDRYEFLWRTSPTLDCVHHVSGRAWERKGTWRYWTIPAGWKGTQSSRSAGSARDHRYGASRESTILLTLQSIEELGSMKKRKWGETEWRDRHTASEDRTVNMLIDGYGPHARIHGDSQRQSHKWRWSHVVKRAGIQYPHDFVNVSPKVWRRKRKLTMRFGVRKLGSATQATHYIHRTRIIGNVPCQRVRMIQEYTAHEPYFCSS